MRDAPAGLDREAERLGHLGRPVEQRLLLRQLVERVVDLDRRELAGVEAEHVRVLQLLGVETPFPLLEREAARSRQNFHTSKAKASRGKEQERAGRCTNVRALSCRFLSFSRGAFVVIALPGSGNATRPRTRPAS